MAELEKEIERYLVKRIKEIGGICYKFTSPGNVGVPDRIVVLPGEIFFVEVKRPGGKVRPIQQHEIRKLLDLKAKVFVIDNKPAVDSLIAWWLARLDERK